MKTRKTSRVKEAQVGFEVINLSDMFPSDTRMFMCDVCCTKEVWGLLVDAAEQDASANSSECDCGAYVWDVCWVLSQIIQITPRPDDHDEVLFSVRLPLTRDGKIVPLKMLTAETGDGDPVIFITQQ